METIYVANPDEVGVLEISGETSNYLEISKSTREGAALLEFGLKIKPLIESEADSPYHGAKVFESGGPYCYYSWIYIYSLIQNAVLAATTLKYIAFSSTSVPQAWASALFVSLYKNKKIITAMTSPDKFLETQNE